MIFFFSKTSKLKENTLYIFYFDACGPMGSDTLDGSRYFECLLMMLGVAKIRYFEIVYYSSKPHEIDIRNIVSHF